MSRVGTMLRSLVIPALAGLSITLLPAPPSAEAHPPHGGHYGSGHHYGPGFGGGYHHFGGGGISMYRSYYGGFGGASLTIPGMGVVYGTQYPTGTLYHSGYYGGGYPPFGWSNLGGLNYGYGAIGGYVVAPYGGTVGPWTPQAYGYYQPVAPAPGYVVSQPTSPLVHPGITGPTPFTTPQLNNPPFNNPVIQEWLPENQRPADQFAGAPIPDPVAIQPKVVDLQPRPSNLEAKRKSIRLEAMGDQAFARRDWADAYQRFKQAAEQAADRAEPREKLAYTLLAQGLYGMTALEMKRAIAIDRNWPRTGASLEAVFGPNSELLRNNILHRLAAWVREDIRDPDRLFVMGVVLHFNGQPDKAVEFLKTAAELTQGAAHVTAFLEPRSGAVVDQAVVPAGANVPAPAENPVPPSRLSAPTPIVPRDQAPAVLPAPGLLPKPVEPSRSAGPTSSKSPPDAAPAAPVEGPKLVAPPPDTPVSGTSPTPVPPTTPAPAGNAGEPTPAVP